MQFESKLPDIPTTIFTVVSRRARETGALDIGQGFPDFPLDALLSEHVTAAMREGLNQYAPMAGVLELREAIARKVDQTYHKSLDVDSEITVTCGGTEALHSAIMALVRSGDEVVIFDPAYDAYEPVVNLAGGRCVRLPLSAPLFRPDWERFAGALSARTRLVLINNPHNPVGTVWTRADLDTLAQLIRDRPIAVLADEVYEHVVFDGLRHESVLSHPELSQRSLAVFSFGKTLHATGWRIGYCVAPAGLTRELRKVHQFNTFSISAPTQHGIARYLEAKPEAWLELGTFFQQKRDWLCDALEGSGFVIRRAQGTYFQLLDFSALSDVSDVDFVERMITEARIAALPVSPFYTARQGGRPHLSLMRVCFAKREQTLKLAADRLREFAAQLADEPSARDAAVT